MALRKREDTQTWKRKHYVALSGDLALEKAVDLSYVRLRNERKKTKAEKVKTTLEQGE